MKLIYKDMGHILEFSGGYVNELVIENKNMFFNFVNSVSMQAEGLEGGCVLSAADKPLDFAKYVDIILQFAPFQPNRKSLLTKLCNSLEKQALNSENYIEAVNLLSELERFVLHLSEDLPVEINCKKLAIGQVIRSISPEIEEDDKTTIEKIFAYMELVRELDREKLFVMVNMRSYFPDDEMQKFIESVVLHDFNILLLESSAGERLQHTKRYVIDNDLCEF